MRFVTKYAPMIVSGATRKFLLQVTGRKFLAYERILAHRRIGKIIRFSQM